FQLALALRQQPGQFGADEGDRVCIARAAQLHCDRAGCADYLASQVLNYMTTGKDITKIADPGFMHQDLLSAQSKELLSFVWQGYGFAKSGQLQRVDSRAC